MTEPAERPRVIKVQLSRAQHDVVRLAAAMQRQAMAEFAREVVLREAERLTQGIELPPAPEDE